MLRKVIVILAVLSMTMIVYPQKKTEKPADDKPIRISTELVQVDTVVTDKNGQIVRNLTKDDFELYENGKKQNITFLEFVEASSKSKATDKTAPDARRPETEGVSEAEVRRIFAFVIDDLTIRAEDLFYVREMLTRYVNEQKADNDLAAIVRTVGGRGLLQQFTTNRELLLRAIASLTPTTPPLSSTASSASADMSGREQRVSGTPQPLVDAAGERAESELNAIDNDTRELFGPLDDTVQMTRAVMTLGTASFVIESLRQLPGRKSLILVSGGMPILSSQIGTTGVDMTSVINRLAAQATRAGVAVHTMDIRGLSANSGVARFTDTPGKSAIPTDIASLANSGPGGGTGTFGRGIDDKLLGPSVLQDQLGLRALASATGGIAVLNKNNFSEGIGKIIDTSDGYYLLAYTPLDANFDGRFRKLEVRLRRGGLKVYSRRGYVAREDSSAEAAAVSPRDQLLAAIRSPLARRDVSVKAMVGYKAIQPRQGAIDIELLIDPRTLKFDEVEGKQQTTFDVAGFVFDETGELRGGFSETITANLTPEEFKRVSLGGLTYSANTTLPSGAYQVRIAVRDNKTGGTGTVSRYLEVPDLTKGRFAASSLVLVGAPPGDTKSTDTVAVIADRQISRKRDLRYLVALYNAKLKDGKPQVRAQMSISQNGKLLYQEPDETVQGTGDQMIKMGQLGLARVKPGRYTITVVLTDPLADKKQTPITRVMDFVVVD
jgi:VWFA-related protein